jgi:uroporphyrinogen-III decarboxylase
VLLASALGAKIQYTDNEWPWAMPILNSITDVDSLKVPDIKNSTAIQRFFSHVRWIQEKTGHRIPIKLMDMQSPFTVAAQLRHYENLLFDMMDDPNRVKTLLEIITDATIQFLELQKEVFTYPSYPGRKFPGVTEKLGICIADDSALIPLSPAMYEEFCLPTMLQIA